MALSGKSWVAQFPTSRDVEDLVDPFRANLKAFLSALAKASATVVINATYRPAERAFLMHYAFRIAREGLSPAKVPAHANINIEWVHRYASGKINYTASRAAAEEMVQAYGIAFKPALTSQHTARKAIDMTISWTGTLAIADSSGKVVSISSSPASGGNSELHAVGRTYNVVKLVSDPPHWSENGRFKCV